MQLTPNLSAYARRGTPTVPYNFMHNNLEHHLADEGQRKRRLLQHWIATRSSLGPPASAGFPPS